MARINLPTERKVKHLTLHRQGRQISLQEYNALSAAERLELIRQARGKQKYNLLLNAEDAESLTPLLHPQEIYLTISELGTEYAVELLQLASAEQITTLLDLDCWNKDVLSPVLSLHWIALMLETGAEKVCQLAEQIEPELLALFLKKHLHITRGIEVYEDDDAENARRLESLYDVEYYSEDAAKIIPPFLQILAENAQQIYLQLMEMVRGEILSVLEEEVYQVRNNRLLDLGFVPSQEARGIYSSIDPEKFVPGGKIDYSLEAEELQHPGALLTNAEPKNLLAEVLSGRLSHELATELIMLANRKMSADQIDISSPKDVSRSLQSIYDVLNLALEYLAGNDPAYAEELVRNTYLLHLFRLGHSLLVKRQQQAQTLLKGPIGPYLDYPEQLFLDALVEVPPALYREADDDRPSALEQISDLKTLEVVDLRLQQIEALQQLFCEKLPFNLPEPDFDAEAAPPLSTLFLTAVANQLLGRSFIPIPLHEEDLLILKKQTLTDNEIEPQFRTMLQSLVERLCENCGFFVAFCLDCWQDDLVSVQTGQPGINHPACLLLHD